MKIYAASLLAIHHETKETCHELCTFSLHKDEEQTPEQTAMEIMLDLLPENELFDCRLKVIPVELSKHFERHVNEEFQESKEV